MYLRVVSEVGSSGPGAEGSVESGIEGVIAAAVDEVVTTAPAGVPHAGGESAVGRAHELSLHVCPDVDTADAALVHLKNAAHDVLDLRFDRDDLRGVDHGIGAEDHEEVRKPADGGAEEGLGTAVPRLREAAAVLAPDDVERRVVSHTKAGSHDYGVDFPEGAVRGEDSALLHLDDSVRHHLHIG